MSCAPVLIEARRVREAGDFAIKAIDGGHRSESALLELLAYAKQLRNANTRHVLNHIESICGECGHTKTEDGCAFCITQAHRLRPKMVCLCGSLRFAEEFKKQELEHLMRGEIALMPCCMFTDIQRSHGEESEYKKRADERHKQLIDIADEVLVLNVGGYVGNSTRAEIEYAEAHGKLVRWLNPPDATPKGSQ